MINYKKLANLVNLLLVVLPLVSCTPVDNPEKIWEFSSVGLFSANLTPDGKYSLCATVDKGVSYWDLESNQEKFRFNHGIDPKTRQPKTITQVALAPDESIGATALPGEIGIWDLKTGKSLRYWSLPHSDRQILSLSLSEYGKYALIGFTGSKATLINLVTGQTLKEFEHADSIRTVSLSHKGQFALLGSDDKYLRLWDLNTGNLFKQWLMESAVQYATFSPDDQFILVSQTLGKGKIISVQTGETISSLSNQFGHDFSLGSNSLLSAAFFDNNRYIAAGCSPRYIRIFDVKTGKLTKQFSLSKKTNWITSPAPIIALAITANNQVIAQSSNGLGYLYSLYGSTVNVVNTE
jgi:WD40 repeat protein